MIRQIVDGLQYPIVVALDAASEVPRLASQSARRTVVISDRRVCERGREIGSALRDAGIDVCGTLDLPAGERRKTMQGAVHVHRWLAAAGADRHTTIVAVGGGSLTDLVGFAAATFMRGLPWLAVPTTLLGMVDAAIGGKTGVDLPEGKNLVGAFWDPVAVVADLMALDSLPLAQRRAGMAEIIKAGVIADSSLLHKATKQKLRAPAAEWAAIVRDAAGVKANIVANDLRDRGVRAVLNLGHTTGHAIEAVSRFRIGHGPAISLGMRVAGVLARDAIGWPLEDHQQMLRALRHARLPLEIPQISPDEILSAMKMDKKRVDGKIGFVLPHRIGDVRTNVELTSEAIRGALQTCSARPGESGW